MVVYKAENLYESWVKGGLKGCVYNVTKSGWFDSACFQQWFVEIFMKTVAEKPGKYVLLEYNLASHFNLEVIKIAEQNDVYFAMLSPNATHLLQPLDVCVFSLMRESWRKILQEWKREVRTKGNFNKQFFPSLLKKLVNLQSRSMKHNLESRFQTMGIFPLNHQEPLSRLPSPILDVSESNVSMNETLIGLLRENQRSGERQKRSRGKKLPKPGELLSSEKLTRTSSEVNQQPCSSKSSGSKHSEVTNEDVWTCNCFKARWLGEDHDGNRWIVCDICSKKYHLQCFDIDYAEEQYYNIDIENDMFFCEELQSRILCSYIL